MPPHTRSHALGPGDVDSTWTPEYIGKESRAFDSSSSAHSFEGDDLTYRKMVLLALAHLPGFCEWLKGHEPNSANSGNNALPCLPWPANGYVGLSDIPFNRYTCHKSTGPRCMTCKLKNLISEYWDWTDHPQNNNLRMCENNFANSHRLMATVSDLSPGPHAHYDTENDPRFFLQWLVRRLMSTATMPKEEIVKLCHAYHAQFWTCPKCGEKHLSDMQAGIYLTQIAVPKDCVSIASNYFRPHNKSLLCSNLNIDPNLRKIPCSVMSRNILIGGAPRYLPLSIEYLDPDIKPNIPPYLDVPVLANLLPDGTEVWEQYVYKLSSIMFATAPPTSAATEFRGLFKGPRPGCTLISTNSTVYHPRKGPQDHSIWPTGHVALLAYYFRS